MLARVADINEVEHSGGLAGELADMASSKAICPPARCRSRIRLLIPAFLLLVYVLQGLWFIRTQSYTWDEPLHILAGLQEWRNHSFKYIRDHPPLGHLLPTVLAARENFEIKYVHRPDLFRVTTIANPERLAMRTRSVNLALGVILGVLLWATARKLFSEGAANVALTLFAGSPSLIAHFSLATTDGIVTLMLFVTAVQLMRWRHHPSPGQTALLGVVLGLLLLSKLSAPPFVLFALWFVLVARPDQYCFRRRDWNWRPALAAACIAALVLWAGYFFHVSHYTGQRGTLHLTFPPDPTPTAMNVTVVHKISLWVPAGEYFSGVIEFLLRNQTGQQKFAFGRSTSGLNPLLSPGVVALKWPTVVLGLFGWSVFLFIKKRVQAPANLLVWAGFPTAIFLLAMISSVVLGERHLLPAYPFVLLFASATWKFVAGKEIRQTGQKDKPRPMLIAVVILAVAANAADGFRYAPDYLSYFNVFVPPRQSYTLLADSNLDWGQGLLALRDYQARHPGEQLHLAYFGSVDPKVYGIRAVELQPDQPATGTVVISATLLAGMYQRGDCGYCWVRKYPVAEVLNHSLFVYKVPGPEPRDGPGSS